MPLGLLECSLIKGLLPSLGLGWALWFKGSRTTKELVKGRVPGLMKTHGLKMLLRVGPGPLITASSSAVLRHLDPPQAQLH